jgi:hypothetical protein
MKTYTKSILGAIFAGALLIGVVYAQTPSATTGPELESTGVIADYTDNALILDIGIGEPVQFKLRQNVVYVDSNLRIRIDYIEVGGDNVVDKVTLLENY